MPNLPDRGRGSRLFAVQIYENLDSLQSTYYGIRMTKLITVRLTPEEISQCDQEARKLGITRSEYVRCRLFDTPGVQEAKRSFQSKDWIGSMQVGGGSSNAAVRKAMKKQASS